MNVKIQITYMTDGVRTQQSGTFPLRRKRPEEIAFEWLQQIKREMYTYQKLISVIVDGKEDITEKVNKLIKATID